MTIKPHQEFTEGWPTGLLRVYLTGDERDYIVALLRSHPKYKTEPLDIEAVCREFEVECPICGQLEPHVCRETL